MTYIVVQSSERIMLLSLANTITPFGLEMERKNSVGSDLSSFFN
jgi:hypothetical protein